MEHELAETLERLRRVERDRRQTERYLWVLQGRPGRAPDRAREGEQPGDATEVRETTGSKASAGKAERHAAQENSDKPVAASPIADEDREREVAEPPRKRRIVSTLGQVRGRDGDRRRAANEGSTAATVDASPPEPRPRRDIKAFGNKRLFGALLVGTLTKFRSESERQSGSARKQAEKLRHVEEKQKASRQEDIDRQKAKLLATSKEEVALRDRLEYLTELNDSAQKLNLQETWIKHRASLAVFLKTNTKPGVFYMPARHNHSTTKQLKQRMAEEESSITQLRKSLQEDKANARRKKEEYEEGRSAAEIVTATAADLSVDKPEGERTEPDPSIHARRRGADEADGPAGEAGGGTSWASADDARTGAKDGDGDSDVDAVAAALEPVVADAMTPGKSPARSLSPPTAARGDSPSQSRSRSSSSASSQGKHDGGVESE